jgi:pyridoxal 5'-phosphate synthase pdxT subunit
MVSAQRASKTIGVLALQGAFAPHVSTIERLGHRARPVRGARDLDGLEGIVLPGGESSVMLELLGRDPALEQALCARIDEGMPLLATCAGLILAARAVRHPAQRSFGWLDVAVERNAYGRQLDSKETIDDAGVLPLVLIRAPKIERVGPDVEVLATHDGDPVLVRQGRRIGASFHPELTRDLSVHALAFDTALPHVLAHA